MARSASEICFVVFRLEPGMEQGRDRGAGGVGMVVRVNAAADDQALNRKSYDLAVDLGPGRGLVQVFTVDCGGDFNDEVCGCPGLAVGCLGDDVGEEQLPAFRSSDSAGAFSGYDGIESGGVANRLAVQNRCVLQVRVVVENAVLWAGGDQLFSYQFFEGDRILGVAAQFSHGWIAFPVGLD